MKSRVIFQNCYDFVVCTVFSGKELHRQVGVGTLGTLGSLGGVMVSTLTRNVRDVVSIPTLGAISPNFISPTTLVPLPGSCTNHVLYSYCVCEVTTYLYVCNCKDLKFQWDECCSLHWPLNSANELHRQVGVGIVMKWGSLGDVMGSTPAPNAKDVVSIPTLGAIFPNFISPTKMP